MTALLPRPTDLGVVRVLLVEDNDGDARLVQLMLQGTFGTDIQLARARSLAEALGLMADEMPDCVVLTGAADGDLGAKALAEGAQDYLVKGNTIDETLTRSIRYAVVRKDGEDALVRSQQSLAEAQHIARLGSWELDPATTTMVWSDELCRLYGYPTSPAPGFEEFFARLHPEDAASVEVMLRAALVACESFDLDHRVVTPDQGTRWVRSQGRVESLGTGVAVWMRGTAQDITEQKLAEDALSHQVLHDDLTGLPNRALLLSRWLGGPELSGIEIPGIGVVMLDLDRFKQINDEHGHLAGDMVLTAVAKALLSSIRPGDIAVRWGGDEFIVLCPGVKDDLLAQMADRLLDSIADVDIDGITISASAGFQVCNHRSLVLAEADEALYAAKASRGLASTIEAAD